MLTPQGIIQWYLGTMGFAYEDWRGVFYPAEMSSRNYLSYYSRVFNAVEIDSTFYGIPKLDTVRRWAMVTPDGFRFCLKTPRVITHDLNLVGTKGLMHEFVQTARELGEKLGPILIQFPPSFTREQLPVLEAFIGELPEGARYAVEVRDASWHAEPQILERLLSARGVAWAATQYPRLPERISPTADFAYVRWIGKHGTYEHHTEERVDLTEELTTWFQNLQTLEGKIEAVYGFFNNDYAGYGVGTANRFKKLAGLSQGNKLPPVQGRLF